MIIKNVLSCFDGVSGAQLALEQAGIKFDNYYASEIDPYAISITKYNRPNTIQLGSIENWKAWQLPQMDLLIGGSPCKGFSNAGKKLNFEDPQSKLFFQFVEILKELKPKYFLLENVRMKQEYRDIISEYLGVDYIEINSAKLSAQNRHRLYWTNFPITEPEDKEIYLKDILEQDFIEARKYSRKTGLGSLLEKSLCLMASHHRGLNRNQNQTAIIIDESYIKDKSRTLRVGGKLEPIGSKREWDSPFKKSCIEVGMDESINGYDLMKRIYSPEGKSLTLNTMQGGNREPKIAISDLHYRRLTPIECEKLQTFPENWTEKGINTKGKEVLISKSQRFKALGNAFTVSIIEHILRGLF